MRVACGERAELGDELLLAGGSGHGERTLEPVLLLDVREQRVHAADADRLEHLLDLGLGVGDVAQG